MKVYGRKGSKYLVEGKEYNPGDEVARIILANGHASLEKEEKPKRTRRKKKEDE